MKNKMFVRWIIPAVIFALLVSCNDDDYPYADIPSVALNKFRSNQPDAKDVSWKKVGEDYEVDFEVGEVEMKLLISTTGDILRQKRDIDVIDLPPRVMQYLDREFGKENIEDPQSLTAGGLKYYQVEIDRLFFDKEIVIDNNGNLLESVSYWD